MRDDDLHHRLQRDRRDDEQRDNAITREAARTRNGQTEREADADLSQAEEADDRAERVEERASNGLRGIERPLVDAYSASSKSSLERRKYQKPRTKIAIANAAE